jgi:hypothetical protein
MSLISKLQNDALNPDINTSDLLIRAYVVAKKLKIHEFEEWINCELKGYPNKKEVPPYRIIKGDLYYINPFYGHAPFVIDNDEINKFITNRPIEISISEIEDLYRGAESFLQIDVSREMAKIMDMPTIPDQLRFSKSQLKSIIEIVRYSIIEWCLQLEEDGITGSETKFSPDELEKAQKQLPTYAANQILSMIQVTVEKSKFEFKSNDLNQIKKDIEKIKTELKSPKPKEKVINGSFNSIKNIFEGAGGSILASYIMGMIPQILQYFIIK